MTFEHPPDTDLVLTAICSLLRGSTYDDSRFLHPERFGSGHTTAAAETDSSGSESRSGTCRWPDAAEWAAMREKHDHEIGRLMPPPVRGPRARRGTLSDSRLLVEEYLLRYSSGSAMRRIHPQLRRNVLEAACLEWAAITGSPPLPIPKTVDMWGLDISTKLLCDRGEGDSPPRHTAIDPLLSFVGREVVASFDNRDLLRFVPALGSRLEVLLLRVVDAYASKVRRDPREMVMQMFLAEPEGFRDPDAVRLEADEYRRVFDLEVSRVRGLAEELDRRSSQPVLSSCERAQADLDRGLVGDLIERSEMLERPRLAKRLRKTRRRISARLRTYRSKVSTERKKITRSNRQIRDVSGRIRSSLPRGPWTAEEATISSRLYCEAEALLIVEVDPALGELRDACARTRQRASSIVDALRRRRDQNEDRARSGLATAVQESLQIGSENQLEHRRLVELLGESNLWLEILEALGAPVPHSQAAVVQEIRAKIAEYEERVDRLEKAIADLEAAIQRTGPELRDALTNGLELHCTLTACVEAAGSAVQESPDDESLADLLSEGRRLTERARAEIARIEALASASYSGRGEGLADRLSSMQITKHQQLELLTPVEGELLLLERAAGYFKLDPSVIQAPRKTMRDLRTQYSDLASRRRARVHEVRSAAGNLEADAQTMFSSGYCSSTVADLAARVRMLDQEQVRIRQYREDEALSDLVDDTMSRVETATDSFSTIVDHHIQEMLSVVASARERCSTIDRCTWLETDELNGIETELAAIKDQLQNLHNLEILDPPEVIAEVDAVRAQIAGLLDGYSTWLDEAAAFLDQVADEAENLQSVVESMRGPQDANSSGGLIPALMTASEYADRAINLRDRADPFRADPLLADHPAFAAMDRAQRCLSDTSLLLLESELEDCRSKINNCLTSPIETKQGHSECGAISDHLATVLSAVAELECGFSTEAASRAKEWSVELIQLCKRADDAMDRYKRLHASRHRELEQIHSGLAHDPFQKLDRSSPFGVFVNTLRKRIRQVEEARQQLVAHRSWHADEGLQAQFESIDRQLQAATNRTDSVGTKLLAHLADHRQGIEAKAERLRGNSTWLTFPIAALKASRLRRKAEELAKTEAWLRSEIRPNANVVQIDQHRRTQRNTA